MGLAKGAVKVLFAEGRQRPFSGTALTLGRQDVYLSEPALQKIAGDFSFELKPVVGDVERSSRKLHMAGQVSDQLLFRSLGFDSVLALDKDSFEAADILFDLNGNETPAQAVGRFDLILDSGTIEHVFHLPNALNNIFRMLKIGGRVVHISPSSNHIDHGFYMFSPTLFWDYYAANQFEINSAMLFRYTPRHDSVPWRMMEYRPGSLDAVSFGGLDDAMYGVVLIATKTAQSTGHVSPQQGAYIKAWGAGKTERHDAVVTETADRSFGRRIVNALRQHPGLFSFLRAACLFLGKLGRRLRRAPLKVFARY